MKQMVKEIQHSRNYSLKTRRLVKRIGKRMDSVTGNLIFDITWGARFGEFCRERNLLISLLSAASDEALEDENVTELHILVEALKMSVLLQVQPSPFEIVSCEIDGQKIKVPVPRKMLGLPRFP